jgi:hypothetical protein
MIRSDTPASRPSSLTPIDEVFVAIVASGHEAAASTITRRFSSRSSGSDSTTSSTGSSPAT